MSKRFDLKEISLSNLHAHLVVRACIGSCPVLSCGPVNVDIVLVLPGDNRILARKKEKLVILNKRLKQPRHLYPCQQKVYFFAPTTIVK